MEANALASLSALVGKVSDVVWGVPMLVLIAGTGIYLTIGLGFMPLRKLVYGFRQLGKHHGNEEGTIAGYAALATALSATVGTGNIAGVATAIHFGGPGALVWMWLIALVGMATKYGEAVLAVHFREKDSRGQWVGGPMYYIRKGMGEKFVWLAVLFAFFGMLAGFGIGNGVQAHSVADGLHSAFGVDTKATGLVMAILVGLVILGGIKRIALAATALVPTMAIGYLIAGLGVLASHIEQLPDAIWLCLTDAFTGTAAAGGFTGATIAMAIRYGIARGIFSNEAGLGSAPIAHASAVTDHPVRQGTIGMLGTFIDTIIICSITGLAIVVTGVWQSGENGAPLSAMAFSATYGSLGEPIVVISLAIFAFTTLLGWSLYGERCAQYLFGERAVLPFRIVWVVLIPVGAAVNLKLVWGVADVMNAMMAIPNLIALLVLSPIIFRLTREFLPVKKIELPEYVLADIPKQVRAALEEDVGRGDITAQLISADTRAEARIISREAAVMCGRAWADEVFRQLGGDVALEWHVADGEAVAADQLLCTLRGNSRQILTGERTALNFLQTLMGTATLTREYVDAIAGKNVTLLDTRKTLPGLRTAQKYAVLCGGGQNHRLALYDAFLIKENHIAACGSISKAIARARSLAPERKVIVEVETRAELEEAIAARPDQVMLDEFADQALAEALALFPEGITIELSGSFTLERLRKLPAQVVPVSISVGTLTKHVRAVDLSLRLVSPG